ncbi:hypothetical protein PVAND_007006 [Polypedilum vanderplanki]|uniref:Major facilitator superfamily (MFS) profile domain-containing protein n=1 Tax=Polypedilum vanderplanki TaxID=319348 RepID=A0A9J6C6J9_POLVA|nr:hypothetical protein PVAND_007006 [Polypedilum vanderplanki]
MSSKDETSNTILQNVNNYTIKSGSGNIEKRFSPLLRQILAAGVPIISTVGAGFTTGYSAIFLPQLQSNSSFEITPEQGSWIASIAAFAMAPGCLLGGFIMQKYGRKFAHYFLCFPTILGWIAIYLADSLPPILIGRFLTGLATGLLGPPGTVFIGETSEPRYRGFLLATITLSISLGMFLCHVMGTYLYWKSIALISATIFPCLIFIILSVVPESPSWLLTQHRVEDAEKAFRWLRGSSPDAICELEGLIKKHEILKKEEDASNIENDTVARLRVNTQKPEFYKPLGIILLCFFVMQFSGVNSVAFYTISLMKSVTGPGNEYFSMIIIDIVRVIASFLACVLLKMCYRRTLLMISGVGTSLCMTAVAVCMYLNKQSAGSSSILSWLSMVFLIGYICFISCGLFPLPWVLQGEMLQQVTRGFSSGLTSCFNFICFFIVVKTFVQLSGALEPFGVFMVYALIALIGTLVLYLILPETKNRTLQQIEDGFGKH